MKRSTCGATLTIQTITICISTNGGNGYRKHDIRDRNHPSVIMWSIGNEIRGVDTKEVVDVAHRLADYVRSMDKSRPVTATTNDVNEKKDPFFSALDVKGYNYGRTQYVPDHQRKPDRVMYSAETYPLEAYEYWTEQNSIHGLLVTLYGLHLITLVKPAWGGEAIGRKRIFTHGVLHIVETLTFVDGSDHNLIIAMLCGIMARMEITFPFLFNHQLRLSRSIRKENTGASGTGRML